MIKSREGRGQWMKRDRGMGGWKLEQSSRSEGLADGQAKRATGWRVEVICCILKSD